MLWIVFSNWSLIISMKDIPKPELNQLPINEDEIRLVLGSTAIEPLVNSLGLERFADLPNRREALCGKNKDNITVYLSFAIAKKLYRCLCCSGDIPIGSEHVILSQVQLSKQYTHHHLDFICTQKQIIPSLSRLVSVKPEVASEPSVNAKARRYRYKHRSLN